jgi:hypothetical protein
MDTPDAAIQFPDQVTALSERVDEAMAELSAMQSPTDPAEVVMFLSMMAERRNMTLPAPSLLAMDARAIAAALPADLWPLACGRLWSTFSYRRLPECPDFLAAVTDELTERREAAAKIQTAHLKVCHLKWLSDRRRESEARHAAIKLRERKQHVEACANGTRTTDSAATSDATDYELSVGVGVHSAKSDNAVTDESGGRILPRDEEDLASRNACLVNAGNMPPCEYSGSVGTMSFPVAGSLLVSCDNPRRRVSWYACRQPSRCSPEATGHQLPEESLVSRKRGTVILRSLAGAITAQRSIKSGFADAKLAGGSADGTASHHQPTGPDKVHLRQRSGASGFPFGQRLPNSGGHFIFLSCYTHHENNQSPIRQLSGHVRRCPPESVQRRIRMVRYQGHHYSRHSHPPSVANTRRQWTPPLSRYIAINGTCERENSRSWLHGDAIQARILRASPYYACYFTFLRCFI